MSIRNMAAILGLMTLAFMGGRVSQAESKPRVFELRTYTATEGKLSALESRFRDHTLKLFERHGMTNVVYTVPIDSPDHERKLIYLLAHNSREEAAKSWDAFRKDPEWVKAREESEKDGKLTEKVESVFLAPTDFSPLK